MGKIILVDRPGRLANHLWSRAFFAVLASRYGVKVIDISFGRYTHLFERKHPAWKNYKTLLFHKKAAGWNWLHTLIEFKLALFFRIHGRLPFVQKSYIKIMRFLGAYVVSNNLPIQSLLKLIQQYRWVCVFSWAFCSPKPIQQKEQQLIANFFCLSKDIRTKCQYKIEYLRHQFDNLVGIHIRRTDFRLYLNGRFYYSNLQYQQLIYRIEHLLTAEKTINKIAFVICSDEKIYPKAFTTNSTNNRVFSDQRHYSEDLILLSNCNMIAGPRSSFSMWASYIGKIPLFKMDTNKIIPETINDFTIITSF